MMKVFSSPERVGDQIKADLGNRIFPGLLESVIASLHSKLVRAVQSQAEKIGDGDPPAVPRPVVSKFPPAASVTMVARGTVEQRSAYDVAFRTVYELNIQDRVKLLKLLAELGIV